MGVVVRQGIKQSVFTYFGVLIGAVNILLIYPLTLDKAELGLIRFVIDTGTLMMPLMLVGTNQVSVRFFPYFETKNSNRHNGLLSLLLIIILSATALVGLVFFLLKTPIYNYYNEQSVLFGSVLHYVLPLAFLSSTFMLFYGYAQNFKRIALPNAFNLLYIKIGLPLLAIFFYLEIISLEQIFIGLITIYLIINLSHFLYLKHLKQWSLNMDFKKFVSNKKFKEVIEYSLYAMIGTIGSVVVVRIDSFMVSSLSSLADNGVYTISAFIANVIATPYSAINAIATPLVAGFWKNKDTEQIEVLYKKSSLNLMIIGFWLFACIVIGLGYLFQIMPRGDEYVMGTSVVLVLGASKVIDMTTSINNPIIAMSKLYKFNFYAIIILAILNVIGNYFLISDYGILGAAIASFLSILVFNILKLGFIWWKFKMQPFTMECVWTTVYIVIAYIVAYFIPEMSSPLLNLILKCGTITVIFGCLVVFTNISPDVNRLINLVVRKLRS